MEVNSIGRKSRDCVIKNNKLYCVSCAAIDKQLWSSFEKDFHKQSSHIFPLLFPKVTQSLFLVMVVHEQQSGKTT